MPFPLRLYIVTRVRNLTGEWTRLLPSTPTLSQSLLQTPLTFGFFTQVITTTPRGNWGVLWFLFNSEKTRLLKWTGSSKVSKDSFLGFGGSFTFVGVGSVTLLLVSDPRQSDGIQRKQGTVETVGFIDTTLSQVGRCRVTFWGRCYPFLNVYVTLSRI